MCLVGAGKGRRGVITDEDEPLDVGGSLLVPAGGGLALCDLK